MNKFPQSAGEARPRKAIAWFLTRSGVFGLAAMDNDNRLTGFERKCAAGAKRREPLTDQIGFVVMEYHGAMACTQQFTFSPVLFLYKQYASIQVDAYDSFTLATV